MKKILFSSIVAGALLLSGCGGGNAHPDNPSLSKNAVYTNIDDNEKLKNIVTKAAKEKEWRITKFKANAVIAEKFDEKEPKSTTIKFEHGYVDFDNAVGTEDDDIIDLKEYIEDLSHEEQEEGH